MAISQEQITPRDAVARAILGAMAERRVSKAGLARAISQSRTALTAKLAGRNPITYDDLTAIAEALRVKPSALTAQAERIRANLAAGLTETSADRDDAFLALAAGTPPSPSTSTSGVAS